MLKKVFLMLLILNLINCVSTQLSESDRLKINNFLDEYENTTNKLIENIYLFSEYIGMNNEETITIPNWKEKTLNYQSNIKKYNSEKQKLLKLWKSKYKKLATIKMKDRFKKIENKMENLEYDGHKIIIDAESNMTTFL